MNIREATTSDYLEFGLSTPASKLMGAFKEHGATGLVINDDVRVAGVVTRKQLLSSRQDPNGKAENLMRTDIPRIDRRNDVREVARLMVESDLNLLPVYDGEQFDGVVTSTSLAATVRPNLDALDVADVYSRDLIAVKPETTLGEVIHRLRTHSISRVPVVDARTSTDGRERKTTADAGSVRETVGIASYVDLLEFVVRNVGQEQGGDVGGFDGHGGSGSRGNYRSHTGWGDRAGTEARLLDLPVRDVMSSPVETTGPTVPLGAATGAMLDHGYSSLVVERPDEVPVGMLTLTDVLRSLTWEPTDDATRLQIFGVALLTDLSREDVARMIEAVDDKYEEMDVIEAYVVLHDHRERRRNTPLIRATIRLFTNKGRFAGTGEEFGAGPAIRAARDRLERTVLDDKSHSIEERRAPATHEETEHLVGWWLET